MEKKLRRLTEKINFIPKLEFQKNRNKTFPIKPIDSFNSTFLMIYIYF